MCFSNLPVEFDEAGNPSLAEDADEVERVADCGCESAVGLDEADSEAAFEAVLSSLPESVREEIIGRGEGPGDSDSGDVGQDDADQDDAVAAVRPVDHQQSESAGGD